ncbi:hypothetical protein DPO11_15670 [Salmonella enterica]|nr:hypothetical protein [Salmonella enterica]
MHIDTELTEQEMLDIFKKYLKTMDAIVEVIRNCFDDTHQLAGAIFAAGWHKPLRAIEDAAMLSMSMYASLKLEGVPQESWPKGYGQILLHELIEIINEEVLKGDYTAESIANRLIREGYRKEEP